jgi:hypothetical protein
VFVHAERLSARSIEAALERGDFYSSTGVELAGYDATEEGVWLDVRAVPSRSYRVQFIGQNGRVLEETTSPRASYSFASDDTYVRVKIQDSTGAIAWTQPVFRGEERSN